MLDETHTRPAPSPAPASANTSPETLALLARRRSTPAIKLTAPGPSPDQLAQLLTIAARVPDHGKRVPFRFVVFDGEARARAGAVLVQIWRKTCSPAAAEDPERLAAEAARFARAPVVVMVVSRTKENDKIPQWEQILCAGAVCQTLLIASHAMGFAGQWLTEWCAYDTDAMVAFGLKPGERVAGFVYLGSTDTPPIERPRPDVPAITEHWQGPHIAR